MSRRGSHLRTSFVIGFLAVLGSTQRSLTFAPRQSAGPGAPVDAPVLIARGDPDERGAPLDIGRADVQVTIAGFLARTTTTLTFDNKTARTLEGELVFPLPEDATVSGYGLDVEGQIVDAVVVEAEAARVTFEEETRRGIDPGLVEWIRGNSFRTRVWPIPAQGRRTVRVEYVSALAGVGDRALVYHLPLRYSLPIPDVSLRVEVLNPSATPAIHSSRIANLRFEAVEGRLVASARVQQQSLRDDIRVSLPRVEQQAVVESHTDGRTYFAIDDVVSLPAARPPDKPRRVGLLWDGSLSHAAADAERELDVIKAWLAALGDVEVTITVFRNVPDKPQTITVQHGDATPVLTALKREPRDGGTSLQGLRPLPSVDYYLLVSDGFTNLGRGLPERMGAPIYALTGSVHADHSVLRDLAVTSGGQYISLSTLTAEQAAHRIGRPPDGTMSVEYDRTMLADVLPDAPVPVDGRMAVTGRLLVSEAPITLRYVSASGAAHDRRFTLRQAGTAASGLVPRFWAQRQAAKLSIAVDRRTELVALGKAFGIVTPGTSLLVLETLDQHLRHRIEPPASRPELRAEYLKHAAERAEAGPRTREEKIARVAEMWRNRIAWWKRVPTGRRVSKTAVRQTTNRGMSTRTNCSGAPPAIQGRVTDGPGGAIPGATVTATNATSGAAAAVVTDSTGDYQLCGLAPGTYTVEVALPGFITWQGQVRIPTTRALDVSLEIGALTEAVNVAAAPMTVHTPSASLGASDDGPSSGLPSITITPWDPETPYLSAIKQAGPNKVYATYLVERERHATAPSFYLDCAEYFLASGNRAIGLRVLTSVLDLKLEDPPLLRVVAHRLQQAGELNLAIELFEHVLRLRPEEPQSLRDLALALADRADAARAARRKPAEIAADYLRSLALLEQLVVSEWDDRFPEIETTALIEANRLLAIMNREKLPGVDRVTLDPRLRHLLDLDIRIVLTWDTDLTDMDLWVTEPTGEKCDFSNDRTGMGGMISRDFTNGYGPEEYLLRRAHAGKYAIQANFFGSGLQTLTGPTIAQATVITDFGRPGERRRTLTLRLSDERNVVDIGSVVIEARATKKRVP